MVSQSCGVPQVECMEQKDGQGVGTARVCELGIGEVLGIDEFKGFFEWKMVGNCRVAGAAGGWLGSGDGVGDSAMSNSSPPATPLYSLR